MKPCAVAWDIDGTLVDSEPLHLRALLATCLSFGADLSDLPADEFLGIHMADVWLRVRTRLPAGLEETVWLDAINRFYVERQGELVEMPGAVKTVRALADMRIRQACVSNSERVIVNANLNALGIAEAIEFSISFDDVTKGKPSAEPYLLAAKQFGAPPHEILAVEDSEAGLASATAAGLYAVGFQCVGAPRIEADHIVCDLSGILDFFA
ncbi:MAG: HAD family phosphatase [Rhodospirillales bacterium]|jgi:HAD superfamily hydrolase (TIGR01509 family)|nr:HAD family phosphatase [Rhodospirillales bacterium]